MKSILNILNKIRDFIEVYIPIIAFSIMFLTFILQIVMRYVFRSPLTGAYEITVIGFAWTVIFGACYAMKHRTHVTFTLIYDSLNKKNAAITRLLGNIILLVAFIMLIVPSYDYIKFMNFQSTSVYKIKLSWVFAPFVYFLISIILYTIEDIIEDFKIIKNDKYETKIDITKEVQ